MRQDPAVLFAVLLHEFEGSATRTDTGADDAHQFGKPTASGGFETMAKRSPPTPHEAGMVTASTSAAAMAASTALPPLASASSPAAVASGCAAATIPLRA